jgi:transcriptional regulator GlxA family with amidase domain
VSPLPKTIAFVVYPGLTLLDLAGPLQVLCRVPASNPEYEVITVAETRNAADTDTPVSVVATHTFAEVPDPWAIVVPGGGEPTLRAMTDERLLDYLRNPAIELRASICTGSLLLGTAGLLTGRRATTHWCFRDKLARFGAEPVAERWVEDGPIITAAGVAAGIDMALHLAERLTDTGTAKDIQLGIEYDPQPPHGPIDWPSVDPTAWNTWAEGIVKNALSDHPALLTRLS